MTRSKLLPVFIVVIGVAAAVSVRASDPVGVYCVIDKVVLEPNESEPTTAQIWGAFSIAVPRSSNGTQTTPSGSFGSARDGNVYAAVQKGYLYYACPQGKDAVCQAEWADLKSVAGQPQVVGFGFRYGSPGVVRKATDKPASPDVYPLNVGVVKMGQNSSNPDLVAALLTAVRAK